MLKKGAWSGREVALLRQGRAAGLSWDELARRLRRTVDAVASKARKLGLAGSLSYAEGWAPLLRLERGAGGLDPEAAETVAKRVYLHLVRGSLELAQQALADGWTAFQAEQAALPHGPALAAEPLSRCVAADWLREFFERQGLVSVGQLLARGPESFLRETGVAGIRWRQIQELQQRLAARLAEPSDQ